MAAGEYDSRSELMVGMMYEYGEGIKYGENLTKALIYYKRADEQGNKDAKYKLNILKMI
jgi:TPR repeat protein